MRKVSLLLILVLFFYSCSGDRRNYSVEIQVKGASGEKIYLAQRTISGTMVVDSTLPDKSGKYTLEGYTEQPDFFIVYVHPRSFINLIIHPGDNFRVLTDASTFDRNYLVEGSKDSRLIQKLVNMQAKTLEKITVISERYENSKGQPGFAQIKTEIDSTYKQIVDEHKNFSIDLIKENPGSLAGLMTLYQQLGRNEAVFDYRKDFQYYEMVDSNLVSLYPNSEAVIDLNRKVTELRELHKLEIGSLAPDIQLPDASGTLTSLSSLRGKFVMLIFWASWSGNSITALNQFAGLYSLSASKGVEYYQVSLDRTKESWQGILDDKTKGVHVSDLQYWDSPVVEQYHLEKLPMTYLLSKDGVIMEKGFSIDEFRLMLERLD